MALHDSDAARLQASREELRGRLSDLADAGLLGETTGSIAARVTLHDSLGAAVADAGYVQECIIEDLAAKQAVFAALAPLLPDDAVVASSSSFIPASKTAGTCAFRHRCLVVHPGNPPYLLRVAEVVPAPFTEAGATAFAMTLMTRCGMNPVLVRRELEGFVFNRLQGALLREAYALVNDGAATAEDVDRMVRDGLGFRWSVTGPFEAVDLNTRGGIAAHIARMLPAYRRMGAERGETHANWTEATEAAVIAGRRAALPLPEWEDRAAWRDRELMALLAHRFRRSQEAT